MNKQAPVAALLGIFCLAALSAAEAASILFVGNSFTQSAGNAGQSYNATNVTDANGTGIGGVPGIFEKMAREGGFPDIKVTIEAVGNETLAYHAANKAAILGGQAWDWVVLQDYSTRPLSSPSNDANGTNIPAFRNAVDSIKSLASVKNSDVKLLLLETWGRPDKVSAGYFPSLQAMQTELRSSYSAAAADFALAGWAPVGDAFLEAIRLGYANDPTTPSSEGPIPLWNSDNYHASAYGSYLAASIFYAKILGGDPRNLPTGGGSAVAGLGLNPAYADQLQEVAYRTAVPEPCAGLLCALSGCLLAVRPHRISTGARRLSVAEYFATPGILGQELVWPMTTREQRRDS